MLVNCDVARLLSGIGFFVVIGYLPSQSVADASNVFTLIYSGQEQGQLGLHGCGTEQVGGLSRRQTVIHSLREKHADALNLHTGNILDPTHPNNELIYQIALEALSTMNYDAVCLGPQDLGLPLDSLKALHANQPDIPFVCANLEVAGPHALSYAPYIIPEVPADRTTGLNVAVVGLISKAYKTEVYAYNPDLVLTHPTEALTSLKDELARKSDFVVILFHASHEEAEALAKEFLWVNVLIHAQNEQTETASDTPMVVGKATIVTNPAKGETVGVLEIGLNPELDVVSRENQRIAVSERITPDADLETLLTLYNSLSEDDEFGGEGSVDDGRAVHITYFHKRGCQKCVRASEVLQKLKSRYPQVVVEKKYAKADRELLEAMGALYNIPE